MVAKAVGKTAAPTQKLPLLREHLLLMSARVEFSKPMQVRDFFMILLGWRGFLREDELVNLRGDQVSARIITNNARSTV
jgi:hypothetical protein